MRGVLRAVAAVGAVLVLGACANLPGGATDSPEPRVVNVPGDADSAQEGADLLRPGDMLLLGPGVYREELVITTEDVTVRGEDRNKVVFDGGGSLSQGILVVADGVRVQNLTVHSYLYNGVLVTGMYDGEGVSAHGVDGYERLDPEKYPPLQRYAMEYVTAYNNGLYGVYAFNAQHGTIAHSYASGSADSGVYVGQCESCDVVIAANVATGNAIGFENANASGPVSIVGNRFSDNRVGMTLISNYQEAYAPQQENLVAGNLVTNNANPRTPAQADGGFGVGVGIAGGRSNILRANRIEGHPTAGVLLNNTEDFATVDNRILDNEFARNLSDVSDASAGYAPAAGNCVEPAEGVLLQPRELGAADCAETTTAGSEPAGDPAPRGRSFLELPKPIDQPQMADVTSIPKRLPDQLVHPRVEDAAVPDASLFEDRLPR